MTISVACSKYFKPKSDQTLTKYHDEIEELTDKDKAELAEMLAKELKIKVENIQL